ncbi:replication initiation protein [Parachitinimonas caeni]|uniref:Replication initiation protein n=1 Tax=Parachitinimonas caeni TaxID=3031301 RepID=A0ABT7E3J3_9NEIS|nr:replication initiation protein [Parachitinimonas caeni]MDK2125472.1 replication initiation protein [Parachitinimonas caeni]
MNRQSLACFPSSGQASVESLGSITLEPPFPHIPPLQRILEEAPYIARCSDNKTATRTRPRDYAMRYPYMQINRSGETAGRVSWLIFDLDHPDFRIWERAGLPEPNLIVRDRTRPSAHLYYAINPVCTSANARSAPIEYMRAIYSAMAVRLKADPNYHSGPVAKTPGHPWWITTEHHGAVFPLQYLAKWVEPELAQPRPWSKGPDLDAVAHSRHCTLFEQLRFYAYAIVNRQREEGSFDRFYQLLIAFAEQHNRFPQFAAGPLPWSSIKATVRSVARWTWDKYRGYRRTCHRGVMQLSQALSVATRQRLSAQRTHQVRRNATADKIRQACQQLLAAGQTLTKTAVAKLAQLCRQTVAHYQDVLDHCQQPPVLSKAEGGEGEKRGVNDGVYQISAAAGLGNTTCRRVEARRDVSDDALLTGLVVRPKPIPFFRLVVSEAFARNRCLGRDITLARCRARQKQSLWEASEIALFSENGIETLPGVVLKSPTV